MRRTSLAVGVALALAASPAGAQEAVVVKVDGHVLVRKDKHARWEKAQPEMTIEADAEVRTKGNSSVTVSFDEEQTSVVTIEGSTHATVESVDPGEVFLNKGRVFALIKSGEESEGFTVHTPTAIAGARGTGWLTEFDGRQTSISVFDDVVNVASIDQDGNITGEFDLREGFETDVRRDEIVREEVREIAEERRGEWEQFVTQVEQVIEERGGPPLRDEEGRLPGDPKTEAGEDGETDEATALPNAAQSGVPPMNRKDPPFDPARQPDADHRPGDRHEPPPEGEFHGEPHDRRQEGGEMGKDERGHEKPEFERPDHRELPDREHMMDDRGRFEDKREMFFEDRQIMHEEFKHEDGERLREEHLQMEQERLHLEEERRRLEEQQHFQQINP